MRVLAIRGGNLASLAGDFAVDFAKDPLDGAGIFAITGPTGAGKSTLLDAMSLALFDAIPRLAGAPASGQLSEDEFSPRDPRAILRHGASEGYAELDFLARDGQSYRSRWSVRRARAKADGKIQQASIDLECLDTKEKLGGRKRETLAEIERLIGLNAEQFGRAVVLAQGEFEAFIKASGDERAQLLEKLTGADIYTKLGRKAFEKAREIRAGYERLEDQIARQDGLSDEERGELESAFAEARIDRDNKAKTHESLQAASSWTKTLAELTEKAAQSRRALKEAQEGVEGSKPREQALQRRKLALSHAGDWRELSAKRGEAELAKQALTALHEADRKAQGAEGLAQAAHQDAAKALEEAKARKEQAAPELEKARETDRAISTAEKARDEAAAKLALHETAHQQAQEKAESAGAALKEAQDQRAEIDQWRESNAPLEKIAREEEALCADLSANAAVRDRSENLREKREHAKIAAAEAEAALSATAQELKKAEDGHAEAKAALESARKEAPDSDTLQRLDARREALREVGLRHGALKQAREREAEADRQLAAKREQIITIQETQTGRERELTELRDTLPALSARQEETARAKARALAASDDGAAALRETLENGEPCPVCGATEHRLSAVEAILGAAAEDARIYAAEASEALEEARERHTVLETEIRAGHEVLAQAKADEQGQQQAVTTCASERASREIARAEAMAQAELDIDLAEEDLSRLLAERLPEIDAERGRLHDAAGKLDEARQQEEEKRLAYEIARGRRDTAQDVQRSAAEGLADIERQLDSATTEQERLAATIDRALGELTGWRTLADPAAWLAERAREWRGKEEALRALEARIPELLKQATTNKAAADTAARDVEIARDADAKAQAVLEQAQSSREVLLGGRPVAELEAELAEALDKAEIAERVATQKLGTARTEAASARSRRESSEEALGAVNRKVAKLQEALDTALAKTGLSLDDVAAAAEAGSAAVEKEETALRAIHIALAEAKAALAQRETDLQAHEQSDRPVADPETLTDQLEQAKEALEAAEASVKEHEFRLRRDDEVRDKTAQLRTELADARDKGRVWEELAHLIGDAQGKTFRNFAQSLTLDRLLEFANETLGDLKPRYALQRASGGDMLIEVIDNDMGGQVRGLQNLSGGERFLVSLALALGLAEMSTGRGVKIESLFIDEGFGALDSASLGQALSVLEHLHAQGRRVGVISHVEELKERIPVKIEVSPVSGGRSEIAVVAQ